MRKVVCLAILCLLVVTLFPNAYSGGYGTYPPPANGDWVITNETLVENETIVLNGNLVIESGGNLTLRNVTLKMNCVENGTYHIEVQHGGAMHILEGSNITSNTPDGAHRFEFWVRENAVFEMRDSEFHECGYYIDYWIYETKGLYIEADGSKISNSFFSDNMDGITINNSDFNEINNCTFIDNSLGIDFNNARFNNVINCDFKENGIGIYSYFTHNNSIIDCDFNGDQFAFHFAGYNATIINNSFRNNGWGIYDLSPGCFMRNNSFVNIEYDFFLTEYIPDYEIRYDIDTSNTIDGLPIYCIINQKDMEISPDTGYDEIGYLGVINSENITIKDINLGEGAMGLQLLNVSHSEVINVTVNGNIRGIGLVGSSNNLIENCFIEDNGAGMIIWRNSLNNTIRNNSFMNNFFGIWFLGSHDNSLYHNNFLSSDNHTNGADHLQIWDDGRTGGNFWDDYSGLDNGSNNRIAGDGIGDTDIPHLELDNFPFMEMDGWLTYDPLDTDSDGIWNLIDPDDDNDGYNDTIEQEEETDPLDPLSKPEDTDRDLIPDSTDPDIDDDGFPNEDDHFPQDPNKWREEGDGESNWILIIAFFILILFSFIIVGLMIKKRVKRT